MSACPSRSESSTERSRLATAKKLGEQADVLRDNAQASCLTDKQRVLLLRKAAAADQQACRWLNNAQSRTSFSRGARLAAQDQLRQP